MSDSDSEWSDDGDLEEPEPKRRLTPSVKVQSLLESTKLLKNDRRKSVLGKHPIAASNQAHPPKLDEAVAALVPKTAKSHDNFLSRLQRYTLDAMGPMIWLLDQLDQGKVIDLKAGKGAIKASISLLSNASAHFNLERRKALIKHLNRDLQPLAEGEFPDRGVYLFGEDFGKQAKSMSDNIKALQGVQPKRQGLFSGSGGPNKRYPPKPQGRRPSWGNQLAGQCSRDWTLPQAPRDNLPGGQTTLQEPSQIMPSPPWSDAVTPPTDLTMPTRAISQDLGFITPAPMGILAGRTALHLRNWEKITSDPWVLEAVSGYRLELISSPSRNTIPITATQQDMELKISEEIKAMTAKGAIRPVANPSTQGFFSRIFLVPKKDGGSRPVINLRPLNQYIKYQHFKMEGMHVVQDLLQSGDWMCRIDLKDAYFSIPVHQDDRRYLRFIWQNQHYEFTCLPFGLSSAPRVFTKILRPIMGFFRTQGIRGVIYLDDLLIMHQDRQAVYDKLAMVLATLERLGFLVNYPKSQLVPS